MEKEELDELLKKYGLSKKSESLVYGEVYIQSDEFLGDMAGWLERYLIIEQPIDLRRCNFKIEETHYDFDGVSDFRKFYSNEGQSLEEFIEQECCFFI